MKNSFRIAEIAFGASRFGEQAEFKFDKHHFEVQRFGVDFNVNHAKELIRSLRADVDAICFSNFPDTIRYRNRSFSHRQYLELQRYPTSVPKCDGSAFREILLIDGVNRAISDGRIDPSEGIFFPTGLLYLDVAKELRKNYENSLYFGDAYFITGLPIIKRPTNFSALTYAFLHLANLRDIKTNVPTEKRKLSDLFQSLILPKIKNCEYIFSHLSTLLMFDNVGEIVRDKQILVPYTHPGSIDEISPFNPKKIIDLMPPQLKLHPFISYSVLEACVRLSHGITTDLPIDKWEEVLGKQLQLSESTKSHVAMNKPDLQMGLSKKFNRLKGHIRGRRKPVDFAFVVHALSQRDLARVPGLGFMTSSPPAVTSGIERAMSFAPGVVYGRIQNIISEESGKEVNGLIYGLFSTPKAMKSARPEVIYNKIEKLCHSAANEGAKIIGLGAYTKVVGDSGYTINRNSPIPVTTGNSLSASATLWSAKEAIAQLGFIGIDPESGRIHGVAMVIGATGSIGRVSAKLLASGFKQLIIVAPRQEKLNILKKELEVAFPQCQVVTSTNANEWAPFSDLIVTATSAFDQKIVEVESLKPGSVVCDCSRPLDFSAEDALKRPDVLIIESGELVLPGPYNMTCDLGLPGKTVYACLAETALLSLEGRFESFTLGRDIQWEKVKEIYKLCLKHGVKLADIQSHAGTVTKKEIDVIRARAIANGAIPFESREGI